MVAYNSIIIQRQNYKFYFSGQSKSFNQTRDRQLQPIVFCGRHQNNTIKQKYKQRQNQQQLTRTGQQTIREYKGPRKKKGQIFDLGTSSKQQILRSKNNSQSSSELSNEDADRSNRKSFYYRQKFGDRKVYFRRPEFDQPPKFDGWDIDEDEYFEEEKEEEEDKEQNNNQQQVQYDRKQNNRDQKQTSYDNLSPQTQRIMKKLPVQYWDKKQGRRTPKPQNISWCLEDIDLYTKKLENYERLFGNTMVPKFYWEDLKLGRWCYEVKLMNYKKLLTEQQLHKLSSVNFNWSYDDIEARWWATFHEARRYLHFNGHLNVPLHQPAKQPTKDDLKLRKMWVREVYPKEKVNRDGLWYLRRLEEQWESVTPENKQYPTYLGYWIADQKMHYQIRVLDPVKVKLLREMMNFDFGENQISEQEYAIVYDKLWKQTKKALQDAKVDEGTIVRQEDLEFCVRLNQIREWMDKYYTSFVPQNVFDNPELGEWQRWVRRAKRRGNLERWKIFELEKLKVQWKPNVRESQWWSKYHRLRKYAMETGDPHIPANFSDPRRSDLYHLSVFLQWNYKMYMEEKLSNNKLMALRALGVRMEQPYGPSRKHLEELEKKHNAEWKPKPDWMYEDQSIRVAKKALPTKRGYLSRKFDFRQYIVPGL